MLQKAYSSLDWGVSSVCQGPTRIYWWGYPTSGDIVLNVERSRTTETKFRSVKIYCITIMRRDINETSVSEDMTSQLLWGIAKLSVQLFRSITRCQSALNHVKHVRRWEHMQHVNHQSTDIFEEPSTLEGSRAIPFTEYGFKYKFAYLQT